MLSERAETDLCAVVSKTTRSPMKEVVAFVIGLHDDGGGIAAVVEIWSCCFSLESPWVDGCIGWHRYHPTIVNICICFKRGFGPVRAA